VLDAGCNTGPFQRSGGAAGASVVAIDYDPVVLGRCGDRPAPKNWISFPWPSI